jgi:hypothetical protein
MTTKCLRCVSECGCDYDLNDRDLAAKILAFIGVSTTASREPGADPLADGLAKKLAGWHNPTAANAVGQTISTPLFHCILQRVCDAEAELSAAGKSSAVYAAFEAASVARKDLIAHIDARPAANPTAVGADAQDAGFKDRLADACAECEVPNSVYESLCLALDRNRPTANGAAGQEGRIMTAQEPAATPTLREALDEAKQGFSPNDQSLIERGWYTALAATPALPVPALTDEQKHEILERARIAADSACDGAGVELSRISSDAIFFDAIEADLRAAIAAPASATDQMDETYMLKREIHNLKRHIKDYCPAASATVDRNAVLGVADEGAEILRNLIDSIERHGNYSAESTVGFLNQAKQCFDEIRAEQSTDKPAEGKS